MLLDLPLLASAASASGIKNRGAVAESTLTERVRSPATRSRRPTPAPCRRPRRAPGENRPWRRHWAGQLDPTGTAKHRSPGTGGRLHGLGGRASPRVLAVGEDDDPATGRPLRRPVPGPAIAQVGSRPRSCCGRFGQYRALAASNPPRAEPLRGKRITAKFEPLGQRGNNPFQLASTTACDSLARLIVVERGRACPRRSRPGVPRQALHQTTARAIRSAFHLARTGQREAACLPTGRTPGPPPGACRSRSRAGGRARQDEHEQTQDRQPDQVDAVRSLGEAVARLRAAGGDEEACWDQERQAHPEQASGRRNARTAWSSRTRISSPTPISRNIGQHRSGPDGARRPLTPGVALDLRQLLEVIADQRPVTLGAFLAQALEAAPRGSAAGA